MESERGKAIQAFNFVDRIENYYKICAPKQLSEEEFSRNGYVAFWNEWHRRKNM